MPSWLRRVLKKPKVKTVKPISLVLLPHPIGNDPPVFSFTREFPFDIITEILHHASKIINNDSNTERMFMVSPFLLSRVCKSWRSFLYATPSFWSSVVISLSKAKRWRNQYVDGLVVWLTRAGDLPLEIYLDGDANEDLGDSRYQICQLLSQCCSRWRSIDLCSVDSDFISLFEAYKPSDTVAYPFLRSYIIRTQHGNYPPFLTDLQGTPALETLQINGYSNDQITRWRFDPYLIRNVTFTTMQGVAAYTILSSYPHLQTADIEYPFQYSTYRLFDRSVTRHDHIRSLKISTKTSSYLTDSLVRLQTPNLEDLQLSSREVLDGEWFDVVSSMDDFVARSGCHLVRLSLQIDLIQESLFIRMACFLPSLEELNICLVETFQSYQTFGGLTRAFFRKLHPHGNASFLPNLRVMRYEGPLGIETIDPLEALVLRLLHRQRPLTSEPVNRVACQSQQGVKLNFAKIVSAQNGRYLSRDFAKPELLSQINLLVEKNVLWLLDYNGSKWE